MKKLLIIVPIILVAAFAGLYIYANLETQNQLDQYIERAVASGAYNDIQYESADIAADGTITVTGLNITDATNFNYLIEQVQISDMDFLNVFPHTIAITASGFRFPQGMPDIQSGMLAPELESYISVLNGVESIPVALRYSHQYDPTDSDLFNSSMDIGLPDSFDLSVNTTTRNIPYETLSQISDPLEAQSAFSTALLAAEIPELSFSFADAGILDAYIRGQVSQQGRSAEVVREELMSVTQSLFLFAPTDLQALAIDLGNELTAFMEGGKTFNLALRPEFSGSVQQLQGPIMGAFFNKDYAQIVDLLNVEFSTE